MADELPRLRKDPITGDVGVEIRNSSGTRHIIPLKLIAGVHEPTDTNEYRFQPSERSIISIYPMGTMIMPYTYDEIADLVYPMVDFSPWG